MAASKIACLTTVRHGQPRVHRMRSIAHRGAGQRPCGSGPSRQRDSSMVPTGERPGVPLDFQKKFSNFNMIWRREWDSKSRYVDLSGPMEAHCRSECSYTAHVIVRWCDAAMTRSSARPSPASHSRPNQHSPSREETAPTILIVHAALHRAIQTVPPASIARGRRSGPWAAGPRAVVVVRNPSGGSHARNAKSKARLATRNADLAGRRRSATPR
jgi:hypothetical protein